MIKTALSLILGHSLIVQFVVSGTISETTAFIIYALIGAIVLTAYLYSCIEDYGIKHANQQTADAFFYAGECLLIFFLACAHPYLYIAKSYTGLWKPYLMWYTASPSWLSIPRSATEWAQLLYSIPLLGLLVLALFFIMRTFCLLVLDVNRQAVQNDPPLEKEVFELKKQVETLKQQQNSFMQDVQNNLNTKKILTGKEGNQDALNKFKKMLD